MSDTDRADEIAREFWPFERSTKQMIVDNEHVRTTIAAAIRAYSAELEAKQRSWEAAAHEYEEQARFARAERDQAIADRQQYVEAMAKLEDEMSNCEAERDRLKAALVSASEVIDAMVIQFRNRDQQPPEPQLIHAGKIVLAAIAAALSQPTEGEGR